MMRTGLAFEFVGSMAEDFEYAGQNSADARWRLFNSGLGLLDAVGSAVSLLEMKKKTKLMEKVYSSKVFNGFIERHQKLIENEIASVERSEYDRMDTRVKIKRSEAEELIIIAKNEIKRQQERDRKKLTEHIRSTENHMNRASHEEEEARELRYLFVDTITISQMAIDELRENEVKNRIKIAELEDSIRRTTSLLRGTFKNAI